MAAAPFDSRAGASGGYLHASRRCASPLSFARASLFLRVATAMSHVERGPGPAAAWKRARQLCKKKKLCGRMSKVLSALERSVGANFGDGRESERDQWVSTQLHSMFRDLPDVVVGLQGLGLIDADADPPAELGVTSTRLLGDQSIRRRWLSEPMRVYDGSMLARGAKDPLEHRMVDAFLGSCRRQSPSEVVLGLLNDDVKYAKKRERMDKKRNRRGKKKVTKKEVAAKEVTTKEATTKVTKDDDDTIRIGDEYQVSFLPTPPPPPVAETPSPVVETSPPVAETSPPVAETSPPVAETSSSSLPFHSRWRVKHYPSSYHWPSPPPRAMATQPPLLTALWGSPPKAPVETEQTTTPVEPRKTCQSLSPTRPEGRRARIRPSAPTIAKWIRGMQCREANIADEAQESPDVHAINVNDEAIRANIDVIKARSRLIKDKSCLIAAGIDYRPAKHSYGHIRRGFMGALRWYKMDEFSWQRQWQPSSTGSADGADEDIPLSDSSGMRPSGYNSFFDPEPSSLKTEGANAVSTNKTAKTAKKSAKRKREERGHRQEDKPKVARRIIPSPASIIGEINGFHGFLYLHRGVYDSPQLDDASVYEELRSRSLALWGHPAELRERLCVVLTLGGRTHAVSQPRDRFPCNNLMIALHRYVARVIGKNGPRVPAERAVPSVVAVRLSEMLALATQI